MTYYLLSSFNYECLIMIDIESGDNSHKNPIYTCKPLKKPVIPHMKIPNKDVSLSFKDLFNIRVCLCTL